MTARQRAGLAAATFAAAMLLACGDPNAPRATLPNYADTLTLYALNGAPRGAPSAISIFTGAFGGAAISAEASFNYDVAIDLDDQGRPRLYPVRTIASPVASRHQVGIRFDDRAFDDIPEAPDKDYVVDTAQTVAVGQVVLIQSTDPNACNSFFGGAIYAKIVIDSVHTASRQLFIRITADPNCGFRSFAIPGPPTD